MRFNYNTQKDSEAMKITVIHPSRGRWQTGIYAAKRIMQVVSRSHEIEYFFSLDGDDPSAELYLERLPAFAKALVGNNVSVVEATNKAAQQATGDWIVYASDDVEFCPLWDMVLFRYNPKHPIILRPDDGHQNLNSPVITFPIFSRAAYDQLGYFFNPLYKSMWVDCDLYWEAKTRGWLQLVPQLSFRHKHPPYKDADETYLRSWANWNQGADIFNRRATQNGWPYKAKKR